MKPKVYIETTIISYLTAWRSPQLMIAARQEATRNWWDEERSAFELFVSQAVIQEATSGDTRAAKRRIAVIEGIPELRVTIEARDLANVIIEKSLLPQKARIDALHIAIATVHGADYLLTWNCRHIANATLRNRLTEICSQAGYEIPVICTPLELVQENAHG